MTNQPLRPPEGVALIDDMLRGTSQIVATYALLGDAPVLVDPGPASTLATMEQGLAANGLSVDDLYGLLLTHIHLDHAGAAGTLVKRNPKLKVFVHSRGAPHMINPEKLLVSAKRLYGPMMDTLWGEFLPVPEENVTVLEGGETLKIGGRSVHVRYTPGHASHHVSYLDEQSGALFVGDTAGVKQPSAIGARPPTPPPDINIELWQQSLDTLRDLNATALMLTHYGPSNDPAAHIEDFRERLVRWAEFVRVGLESGASEAEQIANLQAMANQDLHVAPEGREKYMYMAPVDQSWQGMARYWRKKQG